MTVLPYDGVTLGSVWFLLQLVKGRVGRVGTGEREEGGNRKLLAQIDDFLLVLPACTAYEFPFFTHRQREKGRGSSPNTGTTSS